MLDKPVVGAGQYHPCPAPLPAAHAGLTTSEAGMGSQHPLMSGTWIPLAARLRIPGS